MSMKENDVQSFNKKQNKIFKKSNKTNKKNKKTYKNQSGGLRIGKGGFGCVGKPAVPCKGKDAHKVKTRVSKLIFRNTDDFKSELVMYNAIKKIDPHEHFFL